ncbi:MAG: DUF4199 domain-containing protein [Prevotella sp.]|nr:DUF4199 domain-containing protein [Prevotella sp.]MBR2017219.1 DUF4199 domain-containing protein [Prevotella sp.]MBR2035610.1 DUF4199 domain-containing protein [Prevotella sp.]MBR6591499.1 DUF4199 domain-containing protein [Prevotella sp.]MBR7171689.1 DUF4199 domain-containing protein [Prevotella sp.]
MTPEEYKQLKAFARIDGALLGVMWIISFACYVIGMSNPMLMMGGLLIAVCSPFFAASRVRKFRDYARDGVLSFKRGMAYTILLFFYAALLFAVAQYVYFEFIDNGHIMNQIASMMNEPQNQKIIEAYGLKQSMDESLKIMSQTRAIDYALNYLSVNLIIGTVLSLPIAAAVKKS